MDRALKVAYNLLIVTSFVVLTSIPKNAVNKDSLKFVDNFFQDEQSANVDKAKELLETDDFLGGLEVCIILSESE